MSDTSSHLNFPALEPISPETAYIPAGAETFVQQAYEEMASLGDIVSLDALLQNVNPDVAQDLREIFADPILLNINPEGKSNLVFITAIPNSAYNTEEIGRRLKLYLELSKVITNIGYESYIIESIPDKFVSFPRDGLQTAGKVINGFIKTYLKSDAPLIQIMSTTLAKVFPITRRRYMNFNSITEVAADIKKLERQDVES